MSKSQKEKEAIQQIQQTNLAGIPALKLPVGRETPAGGFYLFKPVSLVSKGLIMSDPTTRQELVSFLAARNASHLRAEFYNPQLEWHVVIPESEAKKRGCKPDFRLKDDETAVPCLLSLCTIGTNGRNPATGKVSFIGGDIDHSDGHAKGLDAATIERIIAKLKLVPWLQVSRSRSGKGIHFYAFLAHEVFAADNSAMYPLGRALVERIAEEIEEPDFPSLVDKCGSLMFVAAPDGKFELLSEAKHLFTEKLEPFYPSPANREVGTVDLDDEHNQLVNWLSGNAKKDFARDDVFLHAHTSDLKAAHSELKLRGEFETVATGKGDTRFNCFAKPLPDGAWLVGSWGNTETNWIESRRGYRYTILNPLVTLAEFCELRDIVAGDKGYCLSMNEAGEFCRELGKDFAPLDADFVMVKQSPGQIRLEADITKSTTIHHPWRRASKLKAFYTIATKKTEAKLDLTGIVRVAYSEGGKGLSFFRKLHGRYWLNTTIDDVLTKLAILGLDRDASAKFVTTDTPYEIVNEPFTFGHGFCSVPRSRVQRFAI